jgi:RNA polymerase-binding protein DksA
MSANSNTTHRKYQALEKKLLSEREDLARRIQNHLGEVYVEHEPDDEVAQATYSINRDMSAATIERERKTLAEIDTALRRIASGEYGICASCNEPISEARLRALPWARLCITCASRATASPANYLRLRTAS